MRPQEFFAFVAAHKARLDRGEKLELPAHFGGWEALGFSYTDFTEPHGQEEDWILREKGAASRLHIWVFEDKAVLHRDEMDPSLGWREALYHFIFETTTGRVVGGFLGVVLTGAILWALLRE